MTRADGGREFVRRNGLLTSWMAVALLVRIAFWIVTDRVWEDALITIAHARNAVAGHGLTHHPGEGLVHGFTSALSVLIPLAGEQVADGWGITALRVASLAAAAVSILYGYLISQRLGLGAWATSFVLAVLALNQNHIFYGMAGMETEVAVAVLLGGIFHVLSRHFLRSGVLAGIAVLARPDLLLWAMPVVLWALLAGRRPLLRAASGFVAAVAPWVVFTTLYYGSPIPHTIPAKAAMWSPLPAVVASPSALIEVAGGRVTTGVVNLVRAFTPFYEDGFVVAAPVPLSVVLAVGAVVLVLALWGGWLSRRVGSWWPVLAYAVLFIVYRAALLPTGYFDWYLPPFTAVAALLVGVSVQRIATRTPSAGRVLAVALVVAGAIHLPFSMGIESRIQREIEDDIRVPVGLYLGDVVAADEAFVSESAGYFGYYSEATIWDHPGLTSPTAYAAVSSLPPEDRRIEGLVDTLHPAWAVFRPPEWARFELDFPDSARCYRAARSFGIPGRDRVEWGGLEKVSLDWSFTVYRWDETCGPPAS